MNLFSTQKPYIIAGPCGAEDEAQMMRVAESLRELPVHMIRAGVWKPRSKPGHFEGRGELALAWLKEVKRISGKPVCTEVANQEQVTLALKYGLDAVWIGARTTVNPFLVQEIADALAGTSIAVMIKNPVNPDVELWSGAYERIQKSGITNIAAIHRGFSVHDPGSIYRNKPIWSIPIELKRRYKDLPVICDVSHIGGNRTILSGIAQRALDLDFDGLMIETHPEPDAALSDAKQQITPERLAEILEQLIIRHIQTDHAQGDIEQIRLILDSMDAEIVALLGKRMELVKELGQIKSDNNIAIYQQDRWREIIETRSAWGEQNDLNVDFIRKIFELIHDRSIKTQIDILTKQSP
ncbi:MAG: bifunctional 3-deoxy-7-phosphoheptulonate synthase/chorismate mutase type II [Chitinophagaceae bacterium]|nr:bifunctional 3-deoxy-7-phosphoheptulonate synthase/chorismate mutase type II [Chitinophagaceae bacterium]